MELVTRLHKCLAQSKVAGGVFSALNSPMALELLINATDMDFIIVDLQHAAINAADSAHLLRTIQAADPTLTPIARLPNHDVYWIQQSLDAGYTGLIVPLVESAAQAEKLVKAAYYPPQGDRSAAGSIRCTLYGADLNTLNQHMILAPQIESAKGLENVEEIVAVEGVTGVFLGPFDLSLSCGWHGQDLWSYEPFLAAAKRITDACKKHGKSASILTGDFLAARQAGFDIIGFSGDMVHLRTVMAENVNNTLAQLRQM